jgi:hypothetical protein
MTCDTQMCEFAEAVANAEGCDNAVRWLGEAFLDEAPALDAWEKCQNPYWLLWLLDTLGRDEEVVEMMEAVFAFLSVPDPEQWRCDEDEPNSIKDLFSNLCNAMREYAEDPFGPERGSG